MGSERGIDFDIIHGPPLLTIRILLIELIGWLCHGRLFIYLSCGRWQKEASVFLRNSIIICNRFLTCSAPRTSPTLHFSTLIITRPTCQGLRPLTPLRLHVTRSALLWLAYSPSHLLEPVLFAFKVTMLNLFAIIGCASSFVDALTLHLPLHLPLLGVFELAFGYNICRFNFYLTIHPQIIQ